jgi:hypothetical protein
MLTPSQHVKLALCADNTALVATSREPSLLVRYLETYLSRFQHCLRDWMIATVSKSTVVLFIKTARRIQRPTPVQYFGGLTERVETAQNLGVTLDTRLNWSAHVNHVGRKASQGRGVLNPSLIEDVACPLEMVCCFIRKSSVL